MNMELALYRDNEAFWFGKLTFLNHATIVENIIKKYFIIIIRIQT